MLEHAACASRGGAVDPERFDARKAALQRLARRTAFSASLRGEIPGTLAPSVTSRTAVRLIEHLSEIHSWACRAAVAFARKCTRANSRNWALMSTSAFREGLSEEDADRFFDDLIGELIVPAGLIYGGSTRRFRLSRHARIGDRRRTCGGQAMAGGPSRAGQDRDRAARRRVVFRVPTACCSEPRNPRLGRPPGSDRAHAAPMPSRLAISTRGETRRGFDFARMSAGAACAASGSL